MEATTGDRDTASPPPSLLTPAAGGLAAPGEDGEDHGRIGYGRYGRFTPIALAIVLIISLGAIGFAQRHPPAAGEASSLVGQPAPDVTLTLLDGAHLRLVNLRGSVVVLNFWASWCEPCRQEMPLFQRISEDATRSGERLAIVGVGTRLDRDADARALVRQLNLSYPIGRDTATDQPGLGPIEQAFGSPSAFPTTVFIRPDGVVDSLHLGPLTATQLRSAIDAARTSGAS